MREIKFRIWNLVTRKMWMDVQNDRPKNENLFTNIYFEDILNDSRLIKMQYTGLKDKNGKEIYEGDVLEDVDKKYGNDKFIVSWNQYPSYLKNYQIIGNIYENPELMK